MANFIQLYLACIGLMFILKYGTILNQPRNWLKGKHEKLNDLFSCALCLGFWCGGIIQIVPQFLIVMLSVAAVCWIVDVVFGAIIDYSQKLV